MNYKKASSILVVSLSIVSMLTVYLAYQVYAQTQASFNIPTPFTATLTRGDVFSVTDVSFGYDFSSPDTYENCSVSGVNINPTELSSTGLVNMTFITPGGTRTFSVTITDTDYGKPYTVVKIFYPSLEITSGTVVVVGT